MGCNMCVVQKPEEQHRVMLQVSGKEGSRRGAEPCRGGPRGPKEPLVLQVLRRSPRGRPPTGGGVPQFGAAAPPLPWGGPGVSSPPPTGLVDSGTQTDISFESRLGPGRGAGSPGGAEPPPPLPHDYFDPADLGEPERPEELEYEEVELYKASHRDKLGLTVCYRTDGEEDAGIYVGEVNPNSIAAKDGRIREGDRIIQINGVEVQDREEAVAFLTREQQTNISLLLARPESQHWKDSDREDFLDDFGSDEDGELRQRGGPWTPPGQPPSPATPCPRGGPEPDSGVGRTDESTRNEESSEHDLLGDEGGDGPPLRPPPPRRGPPSAAAPPRAGRTGAGSGPGSGPSPRGRGGSGGKPGAGTAGAGLSPGGRPGSGSSSGSGGRAAGGAGGCSAHGSAPSAGGGSAYNSAPSAGSAYNSAPSGGGGSAYNSAPSGGGGSAYNSAPSGGGCSAHGSAHNSAPSCSAHGSAYGPAPNSAPSGGGSAGRPGTGISGLRPAAPIPVAEGLLSQAELRRYRQLRGRLGAAAAGRTDLVLLEEELRHLEFKCRHLLRAQKMERLRERCLRAWLEAAGADPPLADISEAPERDSTSAYNTGESCRSSPLLPGFPPPPPGKGPRVKRPGRDRLLKARAIKILEERGGSTTDDDARSELKTGRYWSREQRKQHLARAREQRRRRELGLQGGRGEGVGAPPTSEQTPPAGSAPSFSSAPGGGRRALRKRSRRILDNWVTIQEMLARGEGGRIYNPLLSVTTV